MITPDKLINFFRPLYTAEGPDTFGFLGSATLVKGRHRFYLVTCAHCLIHANGKPVRLFCGARIWKLEYFDTIYQSTGGNNDDIDLCVLELPQNVVRLFASECEFVELESVFKHTCAQEDYSLVACGFPLNWNKSHIYTEGGPANSIPQSQSFPAKRLSRRHRAFNRDGYDESRHLAFNYPSRFRREKGGTGQSVHPRGMSGGPVFIPCKSDKEGDSEWLLVGVVYEYRREGYLVATTIEQVFKLLWQHDIS